MARCKPDTIHMSSLPAACRYSKPACYGSLQDIQQALRLLSEQGARIVPASIAEAQVIDQIVGWSAERARSLSRVRSALEREPGTARLLQDWLSHAPPQVAAIPAGTDPCATLFHEVAACEEHLLLLFGTLMQQGDSTWARELYKDLLDHRAPLPAPSRKPGQESRPCSPRS